MKVGIITINNRINLQSKNIRSLEAIYLEKYLTNFDKKEVDFISKKTSKEKSIDNYIDINSLINFKDYDELYIHNFNNNFFGGVCSAETIRTIRMLNQYNGKLYYYITDPKLFFKNIASEIFERQKKEAIKFSDDVAPLTIKEVNQFTEVTSRMKVIFTGRDYEECLNRVSPKVKLEHERDIPIFEFMFMNHNKYQELSNVSKIYDICYYGNNRGGYRIKKLKSYFNNNLLKSNVIGFDIPFENNTCDKYQDNNDLYDLIRRSYSSIVIGDLEHENCWTTARFFENIRAEVISFIDFSYDRDHYLIQNKDLQNILYVSSPNKIKDELNQLKKDEAYYDDVIELQKEELKRYNYLTLM